MSWKVNFIFSEEAKDYGWTVSSVSRTCMSLWQPGRHRSSLNHSSSIYTIEIGKHHSSGLFVVRWPGYHIALKHIPSCTLGSLESIVRGSSPCPLSQSQALSSRIWNTAYDCSSQKGFRQHRRRKAHFPFPLGQRAGRLVTYYCITSYNQLQSFKQ
jgi:hypothetical protein